MYKKAIMENKFFLYTRKSTDREDKQVESISDQIRECLTIAKRDGFNVIKTFKESRSAKTTGRPLFNEMTQRIENGEAQGIICWDVNRLSRNAKDGGNVQYLMDESGIKIVTPYESFDKNNSSMLFKIKIGIAEQFSKDLSRVVHRSNKARFDKGQWCGIAPPGYINEKDIHDCGYIDIDPDRFHIVRKMWDILLTGNYTPQEIKNIVNNEWHFRTLPHKTFGNTPISNSAFYRMFRNPFYYGLMVRQVAGELRKKIGNHKPMVTEEEFYKAQEILGEHFRRKQPIELSLGLTGSLIKCACCGCSITTESHVKKYKNGTKQIFTYARCTKHSKKIGKNCNQKYVRIEQLSSEVEKVLEKVRISPKFEKWALKQLRLENKCDEKDREKIKKSLLGSLRIIENKLNRLLEVYLESERLIDKESYLAKKAEYTREKKDIKSEISKIDQRTDTWFELAEKTFDFAKSCLYRYKTGNAKDKHTILRTIGGSNLLLNEGKLEFQVQKPFYFFYELSELSSTCSNGVASGNRTRDISTTS